MKNTAAAIEYHHCLQHGWDPLGVDFEHKTYFAEPDAELTEGFATERSGHITTRHFL